ncbi:hypothetical protein V501_09641 [Pseudogymnoascus sp. VKM F-4519 (FW-2642)]|nr:hypothetical protein V501_09641 [Pseudogymnoascus sp. VKM F-4519 (FW-2642)]
MLGLNVFSVAAAALLVGGALAQKKTVPTCCSVHTTNKILRCEFPQKFSCLQNGFKANCNAAYFDVNREEKQLSLVANRDCTQDK